MSDEKRDKPIWVFISPDEQILRRTDIDEVLRKEAHLAAWQRAGLREIRARTEVKRKLPGPLEWLVDHPRLLRWVYRVAPSWRPVLRVYPDGTEVPSTTVA